MEVDEYPTPPFTTFTSDIKPSRSLRTLNVDLPSDDGTSVYNTFD